MRQTSGPAAQIGANLPPYYLRQLDLSSTKCKILTPASYPCRPWQAAGNGPRTRIPATQETETGF